MQTPKQQAFQFFYKHAGYSVKQGETSRQERSRGARQLAKAERDASALGYQFEWVEDYSDYENAMGDHAYWCDDEQNGVEHSHEVFTCLLWDADGKDILASLSSIIDPSREYRRVIEAELALEVA